MKNTTKRWAVSAVVAAAAGYVAGILTAPKSGQETRQDIKNAAAQGITEAEKQLKRLHTEMNDLIAQAKERASKITGKAKEELEAVIEATKQVKEKAREILSAVHEGDAEDNELKKAVKDAQSAIDNLKKYLKR